MFNLRNIFMNKINISAVTLAISLVYNVGAMAAENMSKSEYKAASRSISADYKAAKLSCHSFAGNAEDICMVDAKGKKNVAEAQLEANYKPSKERRYDVLIAQAKADYAVADERCDDKSGNVKDVRVKEADAALVAAKSNAKAQLTTSQANTTAAEKSNEAQIKAKEAGSEARQDAASNKRDADYAVAKEKCDALAGNAKDMCSSAAKMKYAK
jgi:membrane-associated HD superfamily phosphohydrolase